MQVTKGTWCMCERVYQALFPPPPYKSLGTRLLVRMIVCVCFINLPVQILAQFFDLRGTSVYCNGVVGRSTIK